MSDSLTNLGREVMERLQGPMSMRFLFQPLVASIFAARDGLSDMKRGRSPWLWDVFTRPESRRELLREGWKSLSKVFIAAIALDVVYQLVISKGRECHPLESLWVAALLALTPYAVFRGASNRLARGTGPTAAKWIIVVVVLVAAVLGFVCIRSLKVRP